MPTLKKTHRLNITPSQFLEACSGSELIEVELLLNQKKYRDKVENEQAQIIESYNVFRDISKNLDRHRTKRVDLVERAMKNVEDQPESRENFEKYLKSS